MRPSLLIPVALYFFTTQTLAVPTTNPNPNLDTSDTTTPDTTPLSLSRREDDLKSEVGKFQSSLRKVQEGLDKGDETVAIIQFLTGANLLTAKDPIKKLKKENDGVIKKAKKEIEDVEKAFEKILKTLKKPA
ncbi:hypothetical protein MMC09_002048 [Bachmanniomyces sp. S44760]|nr:hypothetical protein [Bachmanniomyces sp. S44760]